jgi:PAS domain S-box-containing protein
VNFVRAGWRKLQTYWYKLPIAYRGSIAISIPLVCLITSVVADSLLRQRTIELQQETEHTNRILATSQSVLTSLFNAETGVNNYYIGNQKVFLKPYKSKVATLEPTLATLERLVRDRPTPEAQKIQQIARIARARIQLLQQSIQRLESKKTVENAQIATLLLAGTRERERYQAEIGRFETAERHRLAIRTRSLQEDRQLLANVISGGTNIGILCSIIAIRIVRQLSTELSKRERHLNESRILVESIVANIIDGVAIVTPQGKVVSINKAAIEMFGYTADEVVGRNWQQLLAREADVTQELLLQSPDLLDKVIPTGNTLQAMGQRKNGDWFPIEFSINSIAADDNEPTAMLGNRIIIIRDITARQQAAAILSAKNTHLRDLNQAFDTTNRSLIETNRELDQFAYITAHDLKAPLRAISSLSTWIEEDLEAQMQPETRSQMHLLRSRIDRMQALLDSLLEYSRAGRLQTPISRVDVNDLIARVIDILAPPARFTVNILTPLPIFTTHQQPLQQVFLHLIDNAIRHHPTKVGLVAISADLGDRYEFTIADDGDGIDPQYHNRIYTIFQTLKARDLEENIGAGLAIVKKIIEAQGGTIGLESSVGQGANFKFTWLKHPIIDRNITINRL